MKVSTFLPGCYLGHILRFSVPISSVLFPLMPLTTQSNIINKSESVVVFFFAEFSFKVTYVANSINLDFCLKFQVLKTMIKGL